MKKILFIGLLLVGCSSFSQTNDPLSLNKILTFDLAQQNSAWSSGMGYKLIDVDEETHSTSYDDPNSRTIVSVFFNEDWSKTKAMMYQFMDYEPFKDLLLEFESSVTEVTVDSTERAFRCIGTISKALVVFRIDNRDGTPFYFINIYEEM